MHDLEYVSSVKLERYLEKNTQGVTVCRLFYRTYNPKSFEGTLPIIGYTRKSVIYTAKVNTSSLIHFKRTCVVPSKLSNFKNIAQNLGISGEGEAENPLADFIACVRSMHWRHFLL